MSAPSVKLRAFALGDLEALAQLWIEAWSESGFAIDFVARRPWFLGHMARLREAGVEIIVAEVDAAPVGFLTLDRRDGDLDQLCVAPAFQGRGVAEALLAQARAHCPTLITLKVNADNARARRFYERERFIETGAGLSESSGLPIVHLAWRGA